MSERVLVVDDEEVIRRYLRIQLFHCGFEVTEPEDGVEALLKLNQEKIDLIICDIVMPKKNGWEVLKKVRSDHL